MIRLLADENFDGDIVRGVLRRNSQIDLVRVQDVGLMGIEDPQLLEWAAKEQRVLLTHDVRTITNYAYERIAAGLPMPGVIEVNQSYPIGLAIEEIVLISGCSLDGEWNGQVIYLPLR